MVGCMTFRLAQNLCSTQVLPFFFHILFPLSLLRVCFHKDAGSEEKTTLLSNQQNV